MNFQDILLMGVKNLLRRKTRSILAITGVIIGTAAITVMMSLGIGLSKSYEDQIKGWGNLHMIDVRPGGYYQETGKKQTEVKLTDKTIKEIEQIPDVTAITPRVSINMRVIIGRYVTNAEVVGVKPEVFEKFNLKLEDGRYLTSNDKMGMVFGKNIARWFYNPYSTNYNYDETKLPVDVVNARVKLTGDYNYGERNRGSSPTDANGQPINYTLYDAKGIGLLASENDDFSYSIIMNIKDVQEMIKQTRQEEGVRADTNRNSKEYEQATVYVENTNKVKDVAKALKDKGYMTFSLIDMLEEVKQVSGIIQAVLGGIGGISLLVAALGITNTMIMSIYERTKEIGIMKVIGANIKDIRKLFLFEAASIGFFGGLIGLLISFGLSYVANLLLGEMLMMNMGFDQSTKISIIPWYLALGSLLFATAIGVLAGYIPANRAMKLSALESLRNE